MKSLVIGSSKSKICFLKIQNQKLLIGTTNGDCQVIDPDTEELLFEYKVSTKIRFLNYLETKDKK